MLWTCPSSSNLPMNYHFYSPDLHFRNVLHKLGFHRTSKTSYYYASIAMLISFLVCRILTMPPLLYLTISVTGSEGKGKASFLAQVILWTGHIILDSLNIKWFTKIVLSVKRMSETLGEKSKSDMEKWPNTRECSQVYWNKTYMIFWIRKDFLLAG